MSTRFSRAGVFRLILWLRLATMALELVLLLLVAWVGVVVLHLLPVVWRL